MLRNNLFYLIALSIPGGHGATPEGRSGVLFCFVLFLNSTNNRRNDIVCIGCTCFPKPGWGVLFFFPLHPLSPFILTVRPLLFGGNLSGSCFLRELPIPGNSEILPRGPQRLYCFTPPPHTLPFHINMHPNTQDIFIKEQKKHNPEKVSCMCAVCLCECGFTQVCACYKKGEWKYVWFPMCILFKLDYNRS